MKNPAADHIPVLLEPVLELLECRADSVIVDATVGFAGHGAMLASRLSSEGILIGLDVDRNSLDIARERLVGQKCQVKLIQSNFGYLDDVLKELGIDKVDIVLADLGINSAQLADASRGISFQVDGPLDMRLSGNDDETLTTAAEIVNEYRQDELADLIYKYGEERKSRRIAKAIVEARKIAPIETTFRLVEVVNSAFGYKGGGRRSKIHPATRTFQALRIAVNDELGQLERLLEMMPGLLKIGGYAAIISFHSLEDRIVKYDYRENKQSGNYKVLTKKPLIADRQEQSANPRSRSAKLRIAQRIEFAAKEQKYPSKYDL